MVRDLGSGAFVTAPEPDLAAFLGENGLAEDGEQGRWTALSGGVSSDIWRVDTKGASFCVKRALAQLRVAAEWKAPVDRNAYEWAYLQVADAIMPGSVPHPIAHDERRGLFAMAWLAPDAHKLWKSELLAGRADPAFAAKVGEMVGGIHAATARDLSLPSRFAADANFHALRIDPFLLEVARRHPDLASRLGRIAARTAETRLALVHGDVSPKNILIGPKGPILLDAEVAWFGDPAFDLAFCLNHLAIKARVVPGARQAMLASSAALANAYLLKVDWEKREDLEARAAALLPALALARVDGKSPADYLNEEQRAALRETARANLFAEPRTLDEASRILLNASLKD